MKSKIYTTAMLLAMVLANLGLNGQPIVGYSGLFTFNTVGGQVFADFEANYTSVNINEPIQFTDLSSGIFNPVAWVWDFGDGSVVSNIQNPVHIYTDPGSYTVKLTVTNTAGVQSFKEKYGYINAASQASGIRIKIVRTNADEPPFIQRVGFSYTVAVWDGYESVTNYDRVVDTFSINNGEAHIKNFPMQSQLLFGEWLISAFNEILLFDETTTYKGHISYVYDPVKENKYQRNVIIIVHNDVDMLEDGAFPYNKSHPENDKKWKYYRNGEYPVSMLIPPRNNFQVNDTKNPLLLIHGWEGSYELKKNPDAEAEANETSYWFTLPKDLAYNSNYDAWQYYYPYNSAHKHLAICLKFALEELISKYTNKKVRIVTHSMGGLVTLRYLTEYSPHAINHVEKVLFSAPPAHGSLGSNLYYKTTASPFLEGILGYDRHAPSVRDMKLGSDATWFIHNSNLPDLNGINGVIDDYFVLLGTTYKWYVSDKKFQAFNKSWINSHLVPHSCLHPEAANHHDGIVAISSGSLLDHGIGFATFHGNHNDAVHMQSFRRNDPSKQNIGSSNLMKSIIETYFGNASHETFLNQIKANQHITTVVAGDRSVKKGGTNLSNLNTNDGTEYQKGIINIDFPEKPAFATYQVLYNSSGNVLNLYPKIRPLNLLYKGVFKRNDHSAGKKRYYFNDDQTVFKESEPNGRSITYNGCAITLPQGPLSIVVRNIWGTPVYRKDIIFRYCETTNVSLEYSKRSNRNADENYTDTKERLISSAGSIPPDSLLTAFYVDYQVVLVDFNVSSLESALENFPVTLKLKLPDGTIADSTYANSSYEHDQNLGVMSMEIPNPMPGEWHIWLESAHPGADTLLYHAVAFLQSAVFAHLPDTTENIAAPTLHNLKAGLKVDDFLSADELKVFATIYRPDWQEEVFDITPSAVTQDSSFIFNLEYLFDVPGEYMVKYNLDGKYNNYNFERCLHQAYTAIDTMPLFIVPDIVLRQQEPHRSIDLTQNIYNIDTYDTIYFSSEIITSNLDSLFFTASFDSLALKANLSASLADTGTVVIRYTCHYDFNSVSDTITVKVVLPELYFVNLEISDSLFSNNEELVISYSIGNSGNTDAANYLVRYYITQDSTIQTSDYCIGSKVIPFHSMDTIMQVNDTIQIPSLAIAGNYFLLVKADALDQVTEINETNNQNTLPVYLNLPPVAPEIVSAIPGNEKVYLTWTSNNQSGITGYVLYYGLNTSGVLTKIYTLNNDTTRTITGLTAGSVYYFAIQAYRLMGVESELSAFSSATPYGPELTVSTTLMNFGIVPLYESNTLSYQLTGNNLKAHVTIAAPAGFQISINESAGFQNEIIVEQVDGIISQVIYVKFSPVNNNAYSGFISNTSGSVSKNIQVQGVGFLGLCNALDNCNLSYTLGGHANWSGQVLTTYDGIDAAQSGTITHNQQSWFETTVQGPGVLSFWWRTSSESNYDFLRFYINNNQQHSISGSTSWLFREYTLTEPLVYTLKWSYTKDGSVNSGQDCGWVDQLIYTPDIPVILALDGMVIASNADTCFAAIQTIIVSDFIVESDAMVRLIAGENIQLLPLTKVHSGADFHAFIDTTGNYCLQPESLIAVSDNVAEKIQERPAMLEENPNNFFSLFPNPTPGTFTLLLKEAEEATAITVEIYSMLGERIHQTQLSGKQQYEFDLSGRPGGVYLVRVVRGEEVGVEKVVKQ